MVQPNRTDAIIELLPSLYYRHPLVRRLVEAHASRLAQWQIDADEVLKARWIDTADRAPLGERSFIFDLARIGALVPLPPFADEEETQPVRETARLTEDATLTGPSGQPLTLDDLVPGQRVYLGGARAADGVLVATALSTQALPVDDFDNVIRAVVLAVTPATSLVPQARAEVLVGDVGADLYRQRMKLTVEAFLEGSGTAPAILKMVAATMGWGRLIGNFDDWRADWTTANPVFMALAEGAPTEIHLRERPLRRATSPIARRIKAGARWIERAESLIVVRPSIRIRALDLPIIIPTVINLDEGISIAAVIAMETVKLVEEQEVRLDIVLDIEVGADGVLQGRLIERPLPSGPVTIRDVSDSLLVRADAFRVDQPGAGTLLQGGADGKVAWLIISDGRRVLRLRARGDGIFGNAIGVAHKGDIVPDGATEPQLGVRLTYDPALAVGGVPSESPYEEVLSLGQLVAGASRLVGAEDLTFSIPQGESRWQYVDHAAWAVFDVSQWDGSVFDPPDLEVDDLETLLDSYPVKGIYGYARWDNAIYPREALAAFRFNGPNSAYDRALFNDTAEQVEVELGWFEAQMATIRIDVPLTRDRDFARLAALPGMMNKVKASGIKVVLAPHSTVREPQPLADALPRVRARTTETQVLNDSVARLGVGLSEAQPLATRILGHFGEARWNERVWA